MTRAQRAHTDVAWERWGEQRPYFGVLTSPEYDEVGRGDDAWARFMVTGEDHVGRLMSQLGRLGATPPFSRGLDFGCGVGRILPALARHCGEVVGADVAPAMRTEARANLGHLAVTNATVAESDDELSQLEGPFDLIHSYAVLQHIEPRRGLLLTRRLLDLAAPGAVMSLHYCSGTSLKRRVKRIVGRSPQVMQLANRLRSRPVDSPPMQTYPYRLEDVTGLLRARGVDELLVGFGHHGRASFFQVTAVLPT